VSACAGQAVAVLASSASTNGHAVRLIGPHVRLDRRGSHEAIEAVHDDGRSLALD
jgi:hypothetical protein